MALYYNLFCILNYYASVEFSANLIYSLLVLEVIWTLQNPLLREKANLRFFFPLIPFFFQQLTTQELFVHGVFPPRAAVRSTPFQSTCFLVLHNSAHAEKGIVLISPLRRLCCLQWGKFLMTTLLNTSNMF